MKTIAIRLAVRAVRGGKEKRKTKTQCQHHGRNASDEGSQMSKELEQKK